MPSIARRQFLSLAAAPAALGAREFSLRAGPCRLTLLPDGTLVSLRFRDYELADQRLGNGRPVVCLSRARVLECRAPQAASEKDGRVRFEYRFDEEPPKLTCCPDPDFTTFFRLAAEGIPEEFHCVGPAGADLTAGESRTF